MARALPSTQKPRIKLGMAAFSFCLLPFLNDLLPVSDSVMHDKADFFVRLRYNIFHRET